jgi:hypothetical protein
MAGIGQRLTSGVSISNTRHNSTDYAERNGTAPNRIIARWRGAGRMRPDVRRKTGSRNGREVWNAVAVEMSYPWGGRR